MHGDMLEMLRTLPEGVVDSVLTDPPYHLTTNKPGGSGPASLNVKSPAGRSRIGTGFMGKAWDGGDIAMRPETWAEVLRVMKPGAHMLCFGGTRTFHRMAVAIEDAGFETRDTLMWVYGQGFPKSHDVAKGIDRSGGGADTHIKARKQMALEIRRARGKLCMSREDLAAWFPQYVEVTKNWERLDKGFRVPSEIDFNTLVSRLGLSEHWRGIVRAEDMRRVTGMSVDRRQDGTVIGLGHSGILTEHTTNVAARWEGWGTALKPAWEPILLVRKPLIGTVAENTLTHGVGGINVDGCRIESESGGQVGRWPANVLHDGSEEVVSYFPDAPGQLTDASATAPLARTKNTYGKMNREGEASANRRYTDEGSTNFAALPGQRRGDTGSAARFFYCAKANASDRAGSKHPTVKPITLLRYLVRLITPPSGLVLDPFAGSGTTGAAAVAEGFDVLMVEREDEYLADIKRRMSAL